MCFSAAGCEAVLGPRRAGCGALSHKALGLIPAPQMTTRKLSMVAHACHPSTWESKAREAPKVPSLTELQREALPHK